MYTRFPLPGCLQTHHCHLEVKGTSVPQWWVNLASRRGPTSCLSREVSSRLSFVWLKRFLRKLTSLSETRTWGFLEFIRLLPGSQCLPRLQGEPGLPGRHVDCQENESQEPQEQEVDVEDIPTITYVPGHLMAFTAIPTHPPVTPQHCDHVVTHPQVECWVVCLRGEWESVLGRKSPGGY